MKKQSKQEIDRVTRMIGGYFAQQNCLPHPNDKGIKFKENAENCHQWWRNKKISGFFALVMGILLMTAAVLDFTIKMDIRSISENLRATGLVIITLAALVWIGLRMRKIRKTPKATMALKWSRDRETVRYFAERIDLIQIGEHDDLSKGIDQFLYLSLKYLARVILQIEHDGLTSTHPKEDKLKKGLMGLGDCLGRTIPEGHIFDEVREELGFNG